MKKEILQGAHWVCSQTIKKENAEVFMRETFCYQASCNSFANDDEVACWIKLVRVHPNRPKMKAIICKRLRFESTHIEEIDCWYRGSGMQLDPPYEKALSGFFYRFKYTSASPPAIGSLKTKNKWIKNRPLRETLNAIKRCIYYSLDYRWGLWVNSYLVRTLKCTSWWCRMQHVLLTVT